MVQATRRAGFVLCLRVAYRNAAAKAPTPTTAPPTARIVAAAPDDDELVADPVAVPLELLELEPEVAVPLLDVDEPPLMMDVVELLADTTSVLVELDAPGTAMVWMPVPTAGMVATAGWVVTAAGTVVAGAGCAGCEGWPVTTPSELVCDSSVVCGCDLSEDCRQVSTNRDGDDRHAPETGPWRPWRRRAPRGGRRRALCRCLGRNEGRVLVEEQRRVPGDARGARVTIEAGLVGWTADNGRRTLAERRRETSADGMFEGGGGGARPGGYLSSQRRRKAGRGRRPARLGAATHGPSQVRCAERV